MAIDIKFDLANNPESPTLILATRNGKKLGQLNARKIEVSDKFNDASEISFILYKPENEFCIDDMNIEYVKLMSFEEDLLKDSKEIYLTADYEHYFQYILWDKVVDFKLIYCKEWDMWFEIKVELDEATETVKTVYCTQLGQAELSQIMLYNIEINTEKDIERDDYKISILYDKKDAKASILNRLLEKAPHYSITHVDSTIANIQRSFSFDGTSIYDAFQEISEEIGCLFVFHSNSDEDGNIQRTISVYDLQQNCLNKECGYRGEFIDECPKCGSKNIRNGYGEDTTIFVTSDELATDGIELTTDADSVKNCFKLEAGDDLMTATIRNCNPNGTDYIYYFSDITKDDMSRELVHKIEDYDEEYNYYYNEHKSDINDDLLKKYNALVTKYSIYKEDLQSITSPVSGYSNLMKAYYNTIDLALYLESGLMPSVEMSETDAKKQAALLTRASISPVAVNTENLNNVSITTANSAVLSMANIIVEPTYKVEINTSTLSDNNKTWTGSFIVTNYSDEEDTAISSTINVTINNDSETFIKQKIEKALNKKNTKDYSITGIFDKEYNDFCAELKKYALIPLKSFYDACDACLDILIDMGAGDKKKNPDLYKNLYQPYYNKSSAIAKEIKLRESEIAVIEGVWDNTDENNPKLKTKGLQYYIEKCRNTIQDALNFEKYLGETLWNEFCSYRREDTYSNSNYISDGLNNTELFKKALEFIEVAENEIYKSSELQCSISTNLNNLLAIDKFKCLVDSFKLGNWIRVQVDNEIYKLRLIGYSIDFDSFENISVEFSDVTKIKNGIADVENILSQASSMATSYTSVKRQATQGEKSKETVDQWVSKGLNSAQVRIQSNNTEDIVLDENGLLCRSYNELTDAYSPEQLRITHNIMAYTDNNWETVKQAIGKHDYIEYDENKINEDNSKGGFVNKVGYGLTADFVTAGVVSGSQIIGGDIYSDNYSIADGTGSYLNLRDGTFSFGGGALRFEGGKLLINSPDIPTTETITEINEEYLKTTSVYAQNLQVNSAKINGKLTASQINTDGLIADDIRATTISGKTITGSSINNGDGTFRVNKDGKAYSKDLVLYRNLKFTAYGSEFDNPKEITVLDLENEEDYPSLYIGNKDENLCVGVVVRNHFEVSKSSYFGDQVYCEGDLITEGRLSCDKNIECSGNIEFWEAVNSMERRAKRINAWWADGEKHDIITASEDGLTTGVGWAGSSDYSTVLKLRGQTVTAPNNSGATVTSDERLKNSLDCLDVFDEAYMDLEPISFKYNNGASGRKHFGFGASQVRDALLSHGFTTKDFGGFVQMSVSENDEDYNGLTDPMGLIYTEFVSWNTHMIQKTIKELNKTKEELASLQEKYNELVEDIKSLKK